MSDPSPEPLGDDTLRIALPASRIASAARALAAQGYWEEVVAGMAEVTLRFDPDGNDIDTATDRALAALADALDGPTVEPPTIDLKARWDGEAAPDGAMVAEALGIRPGEMAAFWAARDIRVSLMGFQPGFAYLEDRDGGLPDIPRLDRPRQRVTAGSIGCLGARLCLYAFDGPGGWPIIGRIAEPLFRFDKPDQPVLLAIGQRVRFVDAG